MRQSTSRGVSGVDPIAIIVFGILLLGIIATASLLIISLSESISSPVDVRDSMMKLQAKIEIASKADNSSIGTKYALLICGYSELRFEKNLLLAYLVLLENGFQRDNIYTLKSNGENNLFYSVDGPATREAIAAVFKHLSKIVGSQDSLFVFTTDHGKKSEVTIRDSDKQASMSLSTLILFNNEEINEMEFASWIEKINPREGVAIFTQCYSGGFAERITNERFVTIASASRDQVSYDNGDDQGCFFRPFLTAFRGKKADTNKDGKISLKEAFDYSLENNPYVKGLNGYIEKPLIIDRIKRDIFL